MNIVTLLKRLFWTPAVVTGQFQWRNERMKKVVSHEVITGPESKLTFIKE
jgi:hypothetical protein